MPRSRKSSYSSSSSSSATSRSESGNGSGLESEPDSTRSRAISPSDSEQLADQQVDQEQSEPQGMNVGNGEREAEGPEEVPCRSPRLARDQPQPPQDDNRSNLEIVSNNVEKQSKPTLGIGQLGVDRYVRARETFLRRNHAVFKSLVLSPKHEAAFAVRRVTSDHRRLLSEKRRDTEKRYAEWERLAHTAAKAPVAYYSAAAVKKLTIEQCRLEGKPVPPEALKVEFDTEKFCADLDHCITVQGGLANSLQYHRASSVLGTFNQAIRPNSTAQALTTADDLLTIERPTLFGTRMADKMAHKERSRRDKADAKRKDKEPRHQDSQRAHRGRPAFRFKRSRGAGRGWDGQRRKPSDGTKPGTSKDNSWTKKKPRKRHSSGSGA